MSTVVAIDGPAGAGKSTVARMVADCLNYAYINTGSLYRALAYAAMASGVAFNEVTPEFLAEQQLEFRGADLYLNGQKLEPVSHAWEARVLPLNDARVCLRRRF